MKILIVDDDVSNRDILKTKLTVFGYEVEEASNGDEGIDSALKGSFDLIILDLMMPNKNGFQVSKTLKSDGKTKDVPIIILTAQARPLDELRGWESGADEYATKPVDYPKLLESIKRLTENKQ